MTSSDLDNVRRTWTRLAEVDPLWAVLSDPRKEGGRWKLKAFFRTGEIEIADVFAQLDRLGVAISFGSCLDFGCAVGRLTRPLARRFDEAHGIDIAAPMIELARTYDTERRCRFHVSADPDLGRFADATFDFVYSRVVLQHMAPAAAAVYIRDFVRVLRPGGVTVFQIPAELIAGEPDAAALPETAFRATIELRGRLRVLRPGAIRTLRIRVTNNSPETWPARGTADGGLAVRLANQWLAADGTVMRQDDGRSVLPSDLRPDQSVTLRLDVTAPDHPGTYGLRFDLVQEGEAWFRDRGNPPLSVPARVAGEPVPGPPIDKPTFEMHGTPRADVEALLREEGADVVAVLDDGSAGPAWTSYIYVATKRPG